MEKHSRTYRKIMARREQRKAEKRRCLIEMGCLTLVVTAAIILSKTPGEVQESYKSAAPGYTADEWDEINSEKDKLIASEAEGAEETIEEIEAYNEAYQKSQEAAFEASMTDTAGGSGDGWCASDRYMLAKIAMAKAESQDTTGKALVICVVINRVNSEEFPDTVEEVIFEDKQFTPVSDGRWCEVEPDEDCYAALEMVEAGWDESQGATYFERTDSAATWHRTSLTKLFEHQDTTFFKE